MRFDPLTSANTCYSGIRCYTIIRVKEPPRDEAIDVMEVKQQFSEVSLALLGHACGLQEPFPLVAGYLQVFQ